MTAKRPPCAACTAAARWRIALWDNAADVPRVAQLCTRHARPFRDEKVTDWWTVTDVVELVFVGRWE